MDEVAAAIRDLSKIMLIAFSDRIEQRVTAFLTRTPTRVVLSALAEADGEMTIDALQASAQKGGVARATMYAAVADLLKAGLIDRPRRGAVALTAAVIPYVPVTKRAPAEAESQAARTGATDDGTNG